MWLFALVAGIQKSYNIDLQQTVIPSVWDMVHSVEIGRNQ